MSDLIEPAPKKGLAVWALSGSVALVMLIGGAVAFGDSSSRHEDSNPTSNQTVAPPSESTDPQGSATPDGLTPPASTDPTWDPGTSGTTPVSDTGNGTGTHEQSRPTGANPGRPPAGGGDSSLPGRDPGAVIQAQRASGATLPPTADSELPGDSGPSTAGSGSTSDSSSAGSSAATTAPDDSREVEIEAPMEPTVPDETVVPDEPIEPVEPTEPVMPTEPAVTEEPPANELQTDPAGTPDAAEPTPSPLFSEVSIAVSDEGLAVDAAVPTAPGQYTFTVAVGDNKVEAQVEVGDTVTVSGPFSLDSESGRLTANLTPTDFGYAEESFPAEASVTVSASGESNEHGPTGIDGSGSSTVPAPEPTPTETPEPTPTETPTPTPEVTPTPTPEVTPTPGAEATETSAVPPSATPGATPTPTPTPGAMLGTATPSPSATPSATAAEATPTPGAAATPVYTTRTPSDDVTPQTTVEGQPAHDGESEPSEKEELPTPTPAASQERAAVVSERRLRFVNRRLV